MPSGLHGAQTLLGSSSEWRQKSGAKRAQYEESFVSTVPSKPKLFLKQPVIITEQVVCCIPIGGENALCIADVERPLPDLHLSSPPFHKHYSSLAIRRASQRWSTLVSAPTSRIAKVMSPVLGDLWPDFLAHACLYKPAFAPQSHQPPLRIAGTHGGQEKEPRGA